MIFWHNANQMSIQADLNDEATLKNAVAGSDVVFAVTNCMKSS